MSPLQGIGEVDGRGGSGSAVPACSDRAARSLERQQTPANAEFDSERNHCYIRKQLGAQSVIPANRRKETWRIHGVRAEMWRSKPGAGKVARKRREFRSSMPQAIRIETQAKQKSLALLLLGKT